jgi:hypothetical protein
MLTIQLNEPTLEKYSIELWDTKGILLQKLTAEQGATSVQIEAGELPDGLYLLKIASAIGVGTQKILIQH